MLATGNNRAWWHLFRFFFVSETKVCPIIVWCVIGRIYQIVWTKGTFRTCNNVKVSLCCKKPNYPLRVAQLVTCQAVTKNSITKKTSMHKLIVRIISGSNLVAMDFNGKSDPFCEIWMVRDNKPQYQRPPVAKEIQKTQIQKTTLSPVWNESFVFPASTCNVVFNICVWDWDRFTYVSF